MGHPTDEILTLGEVSRLLGYSPYQVRYQIDQGRVPDVPVRSGRRFFSFEDVKNVKRALEKHAQRPKFARVGV